MKRVHLLLLVFALFLPLGIYAQTDGGVDINDPASVVAYLTTFITLAAVWAVKKLKLPIEGQWTLLIAAALSAIVTFITNKLGNPDLSWLAQFGLGLASTFVHQMYLYFTGSNNKK